MAHQIMKMYHPETGGVGDTTPDAFHQIYQFRGWQMLPAAENFASDVLGRPVGDLEGLKVDELREVIARTGADVPSSNTKKEEVVKTLRAAVPGGDAAVAVVANVDDDGRLTGPDGQELPEPKDEAVVQTVSSTPSGGRRKSS